MQMRRLMSLIETFFTGVKVHGDYFEGYVEVFKNPDTPEFNRLMREFGFLRGFLSEGRDVYVWRGDVLHHEIDAPGEHWLTFEEDSVTVDWGFDYDFEGDQDPYAAVEDLDDVKDYLSTIPVLKPLLKGRTIWVHRR